MAAPAFDASRFPVVVVRFSGYISEAEFDAYLASMTMILRRPGKLVTILDARRAIENPASQLRKQADWLRLHEDELRSKSLGAVFVITSPFVSGVLNAILSAQPLPNEYAVVSTMDEAESWAARRLAAAGLTVPAGVAP